MKVKRKSRTAQIVAATVKGAHALVTKAVNKSTETMQINCPEDEGDLKSTIEGTDDGQGHGQVSVGGQSKISDKIVDYPEPVEFGSVHVKADGSTYSIPAQPFFRPGVEDGKKVIRKGMKIRQR